MERVYKMNFASVYPLLVQKAERKKRTQAEVDEIICWLTGYTPEQLAQQLDKEVDYQTFFQEAPQINPNAKLIKGVICGYRVEDIEHPLMQQIRYLDKLIDELAKGKKNGKNSASRLARKDMIMDSIQDFTNYTHFSPQKAAYQFTSVIEASEVGKGGAYVRVPVNIKDSFGKGRLKVRVYFETVYYEGSIVNMGVKNPDGSVCYILGVRKDIRQELQKNIGDTLTVSFQPVD